MFKKRSDKEIKRQSDKVKSDIFLLIYVNRDMI
jgi:hypothetical protein